MAKILIIDDEANNVSLLKMEMEDDGHEIIAASDGEKGWKILEQDGSNINLILLDRMMPNMNGMEFMAKIKAHEEFNKIPVIMQTAAAEKEQVAEGIKAGVYYYLTKPYEEEILVSVVNAALKEYANQRVLRDEVQKHKKCFGFTTYSEWEFKTLDECRDMATFIASYFPDPERVVMGLSELFINAVEHGNLGITYDEKSFLNSSGKWVYEVEQRILLPENADKKVRVRYEKKDNIVELIIKDEGKGFDWKDYMEISPHRATDSHGRGIALSNMMCFDELEFKGCGNEVVCRVNIQ